MSTLTTSPSTAAAAGSTPNVPSLKLFDLSGKNVLITGATRGTSFMHNLRAWFLYSLSFRLSFCCSFYYFRTLIFPFLI
ncbi:uncharacterized protein EI90DRAFT_3057402 [Cantharellus anzutake]|uniref:uncharacterized protein n=1 Tax=Cantharellus anzutake TaxID=1750568 RepID=UPI0019041B20|nr:uncharacterized protein EI90DRAFT_3057402 [Cantharellus anzutake]KAF8331286.1 hypothetical protein EI90DRAFT_3057402 [Cantharellus anzutake]